MRPGLCAPPPLVQAVSGPEQAARLGLYYLQRWEMGREPLRVKFLEGDPAIHRRVMSVVTGPEGWGAACGLQCVQSSDADAEIRIAFQPGDSWSYLGDYEPGQGRPTMNFGWFDADTTYDEMRRTVLHELGHAYSFIHEHESPNATIPWNKPVVYAYYRETMGWDEAMVDAQVFSRMDKTSTLPGPYDRESIMHYMIAADMLTDPAFAVGWNTRLSAQDMTMAAAWYGPPEPRRAVFLPWTSRWGGSL